MRAPSRGERPNLQKVLRPRAVPVAFQHLRVRVVASAASKAHCSGSGHNDHGPHHFPARISKPAQPNNSFKPSPLRGLACAVRFTTPFGRYAGRLNSGVRLQQETSGINERQSAAICKPVVSTRDSSASALPRLSYVLRRAMLVKLRSRCSRGAAAPFWAMLQPNQSFKPMSLRATA